MREGLRRAETLEDQDALVATNTDDAGGRIAGAAGAESVDLDAARSYAGVDPRVTRIAGELLGVQGEPPTAAFMRAVQRFQRGHGIPAANPGVIDAETIQAFAQEQPELASRLKSAAGGTWSKYRPSFRNGADKDEDGSGTKHAMAHAQFLGHAVQAHPELVERLLKVEERLRTDLQAVLADPSERASLDARGVAGTTGADLGRWLGIRRSHVGWRKGKLQGYHRYGTALDINRDTNAWMAVRSGTRLGGEGHASGAATTPFDLQALEVIDRACLFMTKRRADLHVKSARSGDEVEAVWKRIHAASDAVAAYFGLVYDGSEVILEWKHNQGGKAEVTNLALKPEDAARANVERVRASVHGGGWPLDATAMVARIRDDLFPLARDSAKGRMTDKPTQTKNPMLGLMDLDQRLVRAMVEVGGLYWGACEFGGGQSGDLMHFDMGIVPADLTPHRDDGR